MPPVTAPKPAPRRPYDSSRRLAAARRSRAAVLDAARELVFLDGYAATTVRAVAERAGVSPETVYKGFGGKPGLMKALWDTTLAGDDAPLAMAERPELQEVFRAADPATALRRYAAFVRGVHERTAPLFAVLGAAGPEVAELLAVAEEERLTGVTAFVGRLAGRGQCTAADLGAVADACWVLTGPQVYTRLTADRGWSADAYEGWLAGVLAATLSAP